MLVLASVLTVLRVLLLLGFAHRHRRDTGRASFALPGPRYLPTVRPAAYPGSRWWFPPTTRPRASRRR